MIGRINATIRLLIDAFDEFYREEKYCQTRKSTLMFIVDSRFNINGEADQQRCDEAKKMK